MADITFCYSKDEILEIIKRHTLANIRDGVPHSSDIAITTRITSNELIEVTVQISHEEIDDGREYLRVL